MGSLFVIALFALLAGVGIVALIETEPGYLLIAYGGYTVETSFWVGIVMITTILLLLYIILRFLHRLISSPASVLNWAGERRLRQSARLTTRGLISFVEGNWARSRKQMLRGARYSESPLLNYLTAARSSYRLQESESMNRYLAQAADSDPEASIAVDITQAELQMYAAQYESALATLERAAKSPGKYPAVLPLLCKAHDALGDVESMAALLPDLRKYQVEGPVELDLLEARVHHDLLEQAAVTEDSALLQARWKKCPSALRDKEEMQLHYLNSLLACGETDLVDKEILRRLKRVWQPALVRFYGRIPREGAQRQLVVAEGWLKQRPDDAELLLCLGRLAMSERQWAKARDYLERSHARQASEEACLELGRLLTAVGEHSAATEAFSAGTQLRSAPLPELPQPDDIVPENRRLDTTP